MQKTILVVDDSRSIRNLLQHILEKAGYEILLAEDGRDALTYFDGRDIHLLITDLHMPVMDGMELIKATRKLNLYRYIPILFLTTETNNQVKSEAKKSGATGWITKPFDNDKLIQIIKKVLR